MLETWGFHCLGRLWNTSCFSGYLSDYSIECLCVQWIVSLTLWYPASCMLYSWMPTLQESTVCEAAGSARPMRGNSPKHSEYNFRIWQIWITTLHRPDFYLKRHVPRIDGCHEQFQVSALTQYLIDCERLKETHSVFPCDSSKKTLEFSPQECPWLGSWINPRRPSRIIAMCCRVLVGWWGGGGY